MRPTWGWTDRHAPVVALVGISGAGSLAGLIEGAPVALWVGVAVVLAASLALLSDAYGGLLVGLLCAAGLVATRRFAGTWTTSDFEAALVETLAVVATGGVAGMVGSTLRRAARDLPNGGLGLDAIAEPLGLLGPDAAAHRLEEEVERAHAHARPLSVALFRLSPLDDDLDPRDLTAVTRAVMRHVERECRDLDVPFALSHELLGVIFPESPSASTWEAVGHVLHELSESRVTLGADRRPRPVPELVGVNVGVAQLGANGTAEALLAGAQAAVWRSVHDDEEPA